MAREHKWVCVSAAIKDGVVALQSNSKGTAFIGSRRMPMSREAAATVDENQRRRPRKQVMTLTGPTRWLKKAIKNGSLICHSPEKGGVKSTEFDGEFVRAPSIAAALEMFDMSDEPEWERFKSPPEPKKISDGDTGKQAPKPKASKAKAKVKPKPRASKPEADAPSDGEKQG